MLMLKTVYYTSGITGAGRLIFGISIGNALKRKGISCEYTIVSSSPVATLADEFNHIEIPIEDEIALSPDNYHSSEVYNILQKLKPDILIVNHLWFPLYHFINELNCKKIYLSDHAFDYFFSINLPTGNISFRKKDWDRVLAIEPFKSVIEMEPINPLIMRNRNEIIPRQEALNRLDCNGDKPVCLFALSEGMYDLKELKKKYSHLDKIYQMIYTSDHKTGLFPTVDYFNAVDFIVCAGGYNQYWEVVCFDKEAVFETAPLRFSSHEWRINECQGYNFTENGADQLVDIVLGMV